MTTAVATKYETIVGVEVHVQLKTESKLFCPDSTHFGGQPNDNTCIVCLGYPGALPVLNKQAVEYAIMLGLALNCDIAAISKFDRKHYFYPDLPKAYQISQFDMPVCSNGYMDLSNGRRVRIHRAHLEEDAGKLVHAGAEGLAGSDYSLSDLNRAGTPLLEIVSEPDIRTGEEAREYMTNLRNIVRYLGVCDGNLEEGSMRCDVNVSIRPVDSTTLGTKTEVKNMNSFRAVQKAVEFEAQRQEKILSEGGCIVQETRLWNDATQETITMRTKEGSADYRYFPEPDLKPLIIASEWIASVRNTLPELPQQRFERLTTTFGLPAHEAHLLVDTKELGDCFETASKQCQNAKALANWLVGDIVAWLKNEKKDLSDTPFTGQTLAELVTLIDDNTISSAIAKKLLPELLEKGGSPKTLVAERRMAQVTDAAAIKTEIQKVLDANAGQVAQYRAGKEQLFGFFVGQVMKATKGAANPEMVNQLLKEMLS